MFNIGDLIKTTSAGGIYFVFIFAIDKGRASYHYMALSGSVAGSVGILDSSVGDVQDWIRDGKLYSGAK